jgi:hypothetical protein
MSNENLHNGFPPETGEKAGEHGPPLPSLIEEPVPIDPDSSRDILGWIGSAAVIAAGIIIVPALVMPARCQGASLSSKVKWQQRVDEAKQAVEQAVASETPAPAAAPSPNNGAP